MLLVISLQVDATVEADIARRYDVSGYPTIKWFRKGLAYDYEGDRTADGNVLNNTLCNNNQ